MSQKTEIFARENKKRMKKNIMFSAFELAKLASYLQVYASQGADKFGN